MKRVLHAPDDPDDVAHAIGEHPAVAACAVVFREAVPRHQRLVAYVVPVQDRPEFWPALGDYGIYNAHLYRSLTYDTIKNAAYRAAIRAHVSGKTAVDIGTGPDAILARLCVEAGARRVYAIEIREDACHLARGLVSRLGLADRIEIVQGDAARVKLPERVDVCVSETIGVVGSSEGAALLLTSARRLLKDGGTMIPRRCVTRIAAVSLPRHLAACPKPGSLSTAYLRSVVRQVGYPFDLRLCIANLSADHLVSDSVVFEDLDFTRSLAPSWHRDVSLTMTRSGDCQGFVAWINLETGAGQAVDSLRDACNWAPCFFPMSGPALRVRKRDVMVARCSGCPGHHPYTMDYRIEGRLVRRDVKLAEVHCESVCHTRAFRDTPFYRRFFRGVTPGGGMRVSMDRTGVEFVADLKRHLHRLVPRRTVPSLFVLLRALPLGADGEVDLESLPAVDLFAAPPRRHGH